MVDVRWRQRVETTNIVQHVATIVEPDETIRTLLGLRVEETGRLHLNSMTAQPSESGEGVVDVIMLNPTTIGTLLLAVDAMENGRKQNEQKMPRTFETALFSYLGTHTTEFNDFCTNEFAMADLVGLESSDDVFMTRKCQTFQTANWWFEFKITLSIEQKLLTFSTSTITPMLKKHHSAIGIENRRFFVEIFKFLLRCQLDCSLPIRLLACKNTALSDPMVRFQV